MKAKLTNHCSFNLFYYFFSWLLVGSTVNENHLKITVKNDIKVKYTRFWNSTGF